MCFDGPKIEVAAHIPHIHAVYQNDAYLGFFLRVIVLSGCMVEMKAEYNHVPIHFTSLSDAHYSDILCFVLFPKEWLIRMRSFLDELSQNFLSANL